MVFDIVMAKARNQRNAAGFVFRVQLIQQLDEFIRLERRAAFQAQRIFNAGQKFNMRTIGLARAVADPQHMR